MSELIWWAVTMVKIAVFSAIVGYIIFIISNIIEKEKVSQVKIDISPKDATLNNMRELMKKNENESTIDRFKSLEEEFNKTILQ